MTLRYSPYSEEFRKDPWPIYRRMRDEQPAYYIEELDAWALSRFEDVWRAGMDGKSYSALQGTAPGPLLMKEDAGPGGFFGFMDEPEHRRYRDIIGPRYTRSSVRELEESVRRIARGQIEARLASGELDVYQVTSHVALHTIADILGLPLEEVVQARALIDQFYAREPGQASTTAAGAEALGKLNGRLMELIAQMRASPPPEHTHCGAWLRASVDGQGLSDPQVAFNIFVFIVTGSDTLPLATAGALYYLAQDPAQVEEVRRNPELIPGVFEEAARYDQPTNILGRTLLCDLELHGQKLRKGQPVIFLYASANRDEREFPDADRFLIHRRPKRTLAFGAGLHACVGNTLARLEARVVLEEIFNLLPAFEVQHARAGRVFGEFLQGWNSVPLAFDPR